jgi:hypothetical protein
MTLARAAQARNTSIAAGNNQSPLPYGRGLSGIVRFWLVGNGAMNFRKKSAEIKEVTIACPFCGATQRLDLNTLRTNGVRQLKGKRQIRKFLRWKQGKKCIVPSCPERHHLHLHRCLPESKGGIYIVTNCVLVCQKHHNMLEGYYTKAAAVAMAESIAELERNDEQQLANMAVQMCKD